MAALGALIKGAGHRRDGMLGTACQCVQIVNSSQRNLKRTYPLRHGRGHVARSFAGALASAPDLSRPSRPQSLGGVCGERSLGGVRVCDQLTSAMARKCAWHMDEEAFYASTLAHWTSSGIAADDNEGVLGGWGQVDIEDAKGSLAFIQLCLRGGAAIDSPIAGFRALDCGAGVGRVTGNVLLHVAEQVHLVEVSERLLGQAQKQVSDDPPR